MVLEQFKMVEYMYLSINLKHPLKSRIKLIILRFLIKIRKKTNKMKVKFKVKRSKQVKAIKSKKHQFLNKMLKRSIL